MNEIHINSRSSASSSVTQPLRARAGRPGGLCPDRLAALRQNFERTKNEPLAWLTRLLPKNTAEPHALIAVLKEKAVKEKWSQRELARRAGISEPTWRRLARGAADLLTWLPRLRAAAGTLKLKPL